MFHFIPGKSAACGGKEFLVAYGFEKIVESIDTEAFDGIVGVGCGENDAGVFGYDACKLDAVELRHLYVKKNNINVIV